MGLCPQQRVGGKVAHHYVLKQSAWWLQVQTLSLQSVNSRDSCKLIWSVWRPEAFIASSQGKPNTVVIVSSVIDVYLSGCNSIIEYTRIMGLAPSERQKSWANSNQF